eukprot:contig_19818_g4884
MLSLSVVTTAEHQQRATNDGGHDGLAHGTVILMRLEAAWAGSRRIVCADSYFASVTTAVQLLRMELRFIGVVKTATRGDPMGAFSVIPLEQRGEHRPFLHSTADSVTDLIAVLWVDRERRYFTSSASTTLPGDPCRRVRWRQVEDDAQRVALTVPIPEVAVVYYNCCSMIERNNRCRQEDLQLDHKLVTHDRSMRVNLSLLGIFIVDSWLLYIGARGAAAALTQSRYYEDLAAQLIDNSFDTVGMRPRSVPDADGHGDGPSPPRYGVGVHLTPTLKRRTEASGKEADQRGVPCVQAEQDNHGVLELPGEQERGALRLCSEDRAPLL